MVLVEIKMLNSSFVSTFGEIPSCFRMNSTVKKLFSDNDESFDARLGKLNGNIQETFDYGARKMSTAGQFGMTLRTFSVDTDPGQWKFDTTDKARHFRGRN